MNGIIRFLLSGVAVLLTAYLLPGVDVDHYGYALLAALVISIANILVKPILIILMVDYFVPGFAVDGFWWALAFSLILSIFNSMFSELTKDREN
jgi:putative membrane protein